MFKVSYSDNLRWEITVSWSKNAALPILAANFLTNQQIFLENLPDIIDIKNLSLAGEKAENNSSYYDLTTEEASKIRASILLIPIGLLKYWIVHFCKPGWCNIWKRPLDAFDDAFIQAGVRVENNWYKIYKKIWKPRHRIILSEFSVTTTESLLIYLSFLDDVDYEIKLHNIAIEPHVINLIDFLNWLGANIKISYNHTAIIKPTKLNPQIEKFKIIWDYIEAGTWLAIGSLAPNSKLVIKWVDIENLISTFKIAEKIGINIKILNNDIFEVDSLNIKNYKAIKLQTMIFPWFPTDLQPIFGVILTQCNGVSKIYETLFEGRFSYLTELENMGAKVEILNPHQALIIGPTRLKWWYVTTKDLRWWWALLIAGIIANWQTFIMNENIILRGYENIVDKLKSIGVKIEKI